MDINSFLVKKLALSKEEAMELIKLKEVFVNGVAAKQKQSIDKSDLIIFRDEQLQTRELFTYILYYKPRGVECTLNPEIENNLRFAFSFHTNLFPVGRLDKDSEGLLLMTDDGRLYKKIAGSEMHQEKEYLVTLDKQIDSADLQKMASGVVIMGKKTRPAIITREDDFTFRIILTQGLNRQIRRMCYKLGYMVKSLKRIRIMSLELGSLQPGEFRSISKDEIFQK
jgi:23S rRNA pseudouridine2604 synthase